MASPGRQRTLSFHNSPVAIAHNCSNSCYYCPHGIHPPPPQSAPEPPNRCQAKPCSQRRPFAFKPCPPSPFAPPFAVFLLGCLSCSISQRAPSTPRTRPMPNTCTLGSWQKASACCQGRGTWVVGSKVGSHPSNEGGGALQRLQTPRVGEGAFQCGSGTPNPLPRPLPLEPPPHTCTYAMKALKFGRFWLPRKLSEKLFCKAKCFRSGLSKELHVLLSRWLF